MKKGKYKHLDIYSEMPQGWKKDKSWGSPLKNTIPIHNGVPLLQGGEKALLELKTDYIQENYLSEKTPSYNEVKKCTIPVKKDDYIFPAKKFNELCRNKFKEKIIQDITKDLIVCKIEKWDSSEYIRDIKKLIIDLEKTINNFKK